MKFRKKIPYSKAFLVVGTIMMSEGCAHIEYSSIENKESMNPNRILTTTGLGKIKSGTQTLQAMSHSLSAPGVFAPQQLAQFLLTGNRTFTLSMAMEIATIYWEEGKAEGINSDLAFAQMCLETNYLRFTGTVKPKQNNMCGLGVVSDKVQGNSFPSVRIGVRAHIQHLKAYGNSDPLNGTLVDPRFNLVKRNISPNLSGLTGKWALDAQYDTKIASLMNRMKESAVEDSLDEINIVQLPEEFELAL